MILNIRSKFTEIFKSADTSGQPVVNDIVRATILYSNNSYFDGYSYSAEPTTIILRNLNEGNYELSLTFKKTGLYTIKMWSSANVSLSKEITVDVVSDEKVSKRKYLIGQVVPFDLRGAASDRTSKLVVQNLNTNTYVSPEGLSTPEYTEISMGSAGAGSFHHEMILEEGTYEIVMSTESKNTSYTVIVSDVAGPELIDVNHAEIRDPSGEPSIAVDSKFAPMPGVKVQALDPKTISVKGSAITKNDGTWEMSIPRGSYLFKFSKEGYNSTLFEGQVG